MLAHNRVTSVYGYFHRCVSLNASAKVLFVVVVIKINRMEIRMDWKKKNSFICLVSILEWNRINII